MVGIFGGFRENACPSSEVTGGRHSLKTVHTRRAALLYCIGQDTTSGERHRTQMTHFLEFLTACESGFLYILFPQSHTSVTDCPRFIQIHFTVLIRKVTQD